MIIGTKGYERESKWPRNLVNAKVKELESLYHESLWPRKFLSAKVNERES